MTDHVWSIRNPDGGSQGLEFARARIAAAERVLVHAAPSRVDVQVLQDGTTLVAAGEGLAGEGETPMSRLRIDGSRVTRENVWPDDGDLGTVVLLGGGEAGILRSWWNEADHSAWRWELELSNHIG